LKRFSIITVVLNNAGGLRRTAESLREQDRSLYEWLIIDGGSTDEIDVVRQEYGDILDIFVCETDRGLYDAMNKGLVRATGKYVLFLNADDTLMPSALGECDLQINSQDPGDGFTFVIGAALQRFPNGVTRIRHPIGFDAIWHRLPSSHQATFINRLEHLEVPHCLEYKVSSDFYTVARIFLQRRRPVLFLSTIIVETPVGGNSFTAQNAFSMLKDHYRVQKTVLDVSALPLIASLMRKCLIIAITRVLSMARQN
jgi:putative colanic acid biosynthesis glycosyltransferase